MVEGPPAPTSGRRTRQIADLAAPAATVGLWPGVADRAEQVDRYLDDLLDGVDDRADDLDDRVLVWVGLELCFQRGAVGEAQVGADVDLACPDAGGLQEVVAGVPLPP